MNSAKAKTKILNLLKACLIPVALYLLLFLLIPDRVGNIDSILSMLSLAVVPTIIAYGVHFGFTSGIMDFSVGSRMILSGMCACIGGYYGGALGMIAAALLSSFVLAAIVGGLFAWLKIPSIVISFGSLMVFEIGAVYLVRNVGKLLPEISTGQYIKAPESLLFLGASPYNFIILILIAVLFDIMNSKTKIANQARAVGSDELIARNIGISPMRVKFSTYVLGSVFLALASIQSACYSSAVGYSSLMTSATMVFRPMMAVIIGISMAGLVRHCVGIYIGSLCLSIMFTGIIALGWPDSLQNIFLGVFLTAVLAMPTIRRVMADRKRRSAARKDHASTPAAATKT